MGWKSGALGLNIVSDVEKTAGFAWMGTRLTARASSDRFRIREKGRLKFLYPQVTHKAPCKRELRGIPLDWLTLWEDQAERRQAIGYAFNPNAPPM